MFYSLFHNVFFKLFLREMFSKKLSYNFSNVLNPKKKVGDNLSNKKKKKKG